MKPSNLTQLVTVLLELRNRMPQRYAMQILFGFHRTMSVSIADFECPMVSYYYKKHSSESVYYKDTKSLENSPIAVHIFYDKVCEYLIRHDIMDEDKIKEITDRSL